MYIREQKMKRKMIFKEDFVDSLIRYAVYTEYTVYTKNYVRCWTVKREEKAEETQI